MRLEERHLRLPNIGRVRLKETCSERGFEGRILSATIRRRADRWFVSLCVERERSIVPTRSIERPRDVVGIDLGLAAAAVIHDGSTVRVIVLEDLYVKGMQRCHSLALSVGDAGMGELRRPLAYKSEWYGSTLVLADRFFPSSRLCSGCGKIKETLGLGERVFTCDTCGLVLDRDENAALNLRNLVQLPEGLRD